MISFDTFLLAGFLGTQIREFCGFSKDYIVVRRSIVYMRFFRAHLLQHSIVTANSANSRMMNVIESCFDVPFWN